MDTIALKVISFNSIAKVISIIRNYNPVSMGGIRTAIENGSYVLEYDFFSHWGVRELRRCYDELTKAGIMHRTARPPSGFFRVLPARECFHSWEILLWKVFGRMNS